MLQLSCELLLQAVLYNILFGQHEVQKQEKKQGKILSSDEINLSQIRHCTGLTFTCFSLGFV